MPRVGSDAEIVRGAFQSMALGLVETEEQRARMVERWWHPEIEYIEDPSWPGSSSYRGREEVRRTFEGYIEVLGGSFEVERVEDGSDGVFAVVGVAGKTTGAEIPWEQRWAYHCRVLDGQISYFRAYLDVDEAGRAAGVSPS
jgi:ketosteroid isomerase-like protein